jgi:hypothetical protein
MKNEKQRNEKGRAMLNIEYPMLNVEGKYTIRKRVLSFQLKACSCLYCGLPTADSGLPL